MLKKYLKKIKSQISNKLIEGNNNIILNGDTKASRIPKGMRLNIKGDNNKIVFTGKVEKPCSLKVVIKGSNNEIVIGDIKNPSTLKISINGVQNSVNIEGSISFKSSEVEISGSENVFSIKSPLRIVKNCYFCLSGLAEVHIGKDCGLNMGLYAIVNNNYKNKHKLVIGDGVFIGKDVIIRTSDGHSILDPESGRPINEPEDVIIGDNVWIGARNMILKGASIPSHSIVGAQSVVNKKFEEEHVLLAGSPARIVRKGVYWDIKSYGVLSKELDMEVM